LAEVSMLSDPTDRQESSGVESFQILLALQTEQNWTGSFGYRQFFCYVRRATVCLLSHSVDDVEG